MALTMSDLAYLPDTRRVAVAIRVQRRVVAIAAATALQDAGIEVVDHGCPTTVVVSDRPDGLGDDGPKTVFLVGSGPVASQEAVQALLAGRVAAVASADDPEQLPAVLAAVRAGLVVVPASVLAAAQAVPALTERQRRVLHLLAAGRSTAQMAMQLHVSAVTVKREVRELMRIFDCASRPALVSAACRADVL